MDDDDELNVNVAVRDVLMRISSVTARSSPSMAVNGSSVSIRNR